MKLEACPVDPPGSGNAPLSSSTMLRHPSWARWCASEFPTMPAPTMTTSARSGSVSICYSNRVGDCLVVVRRGISQHGADLLFEARDVFSQDLLSRVGVAGVYRLEQLAVGFHGGREMFDAVEHQKPHAQAVQVVLFERSSEAGVVRRPIHPAVNP